MSEDLISIKTRNEFREYMVGWVLREISDEFDAARIGCDLSYAPPVGGQRRTLIEQYYHTVDWKKWSEVKPVLQVFEEVLHMAEKLAAEPEPLFQKGRQNTLDKLLRCLKKDGFQWVNGRIVPLAKSNISLLANIKETAVTFDAAHMAEQIRRMEAAVDSDPSLAIGTAKELIETCCKTILAARGNPVTGTPEMSTLTKETLKELNLVPEGIPDQARGADVIKRLLSNLGTIGNGLAELRGLYGTGHGKHGSAVGLKPRHAKLAVGAAAALAVFLFETHEETQS
jgi:hypothetical protein